MPNLWWILIIGLGIVFAALVLVIIQQIAHSTGRSVMQWIASRRYARWAKKSNKAARLKRLEVTSFQGWPLPTGKEGTLRITYFDQMNLTHMPNTTLERVYFDRARDLGVELEYMRDDLTRDLVFRWKPAKKQKEVY